MNQSSRVFLDANASHPLLPSVRKGMANLLTSGAPELCNPSSVHRDGQYARAKVASLRNRLIQMIGRDDAEELIFTSGATEACNCALRGFVEDRKAQGRDAILVCPSVEHGAVIDTVKHLGAHNRIIDVRHDGQINPIELEALLKDALANPKVDVLLCVQIVNNETGIAQDLESWLPGLVQQMRPRLFVHLDGAQALCKIDDARLRRLVHWADYLSLSAHKLGGPMGIGALWVRPQSPFVAQQTGGTQEKRRRAGTLNALGLWGFDEALKDWAANGDAYRAQWIDHKKFLLGEFKKIPGLVVHNGDREVDLANTINFHVEGCSEESLLLTLDLSGYSMSSGSACNSGSMRPSHVIKALGYPELVAFSSLRLSMGVETTRAELERFVATLKTKVDHIRSSRAQSARELPQIKA